MKVVKKKRTDWKVDDVTWKVCDVTDLSVLTKDLRVRAKATFVKTTYRSLNWLQNRLRRSTGVRLGWVSERVSEKGAGGGEGGGRKIRPTVKHRKDTESEILIRVKQNQRQLVCSKVRSSTPTSTSTSTSSTSATKASQSDAASTTTRLSFPAGMIQPGDKTKVTQVPLTLLQLSLELEWA